MMKSYKKSFKLSVTVCLFLAGMAFAPDFDAQTTQVFKVEPIEKAKALTKDSINNFASFNPIFVEGKTYLRWLVKNDRKDGVFIVERSDDGELFEALGFKDRVATQADVNLFYSYVDENPPADHAHYRIMQVGVDQTYNYSATVRVKTAVAKPGTSSAASSDEK